MMKSDKDYALINLDSEYNLNDDFYSIEQSISKSDNEHKEILFNLTFENSLLLNHETLDIKEHINDNITDKRYFIGKKTKADTVKIDNQNNIKKNNNLFQTVIFYITHPVYMYVSIITQNIEKNVWVF